MIRSASPAAQNQLVLLRIAVLVSRSQA
jgi:hypothetical protein